MPKFTHLHLHTVHSLLDGFTKIPDLVSVVKEQGMDAVAITDHGNMSGIPALFKEAKDAGIKPIAGMEAYVCEDATVRGGGKDEKKPYYHLTLLAQTERGYRNLCKLSTLSWTEGFYSKPRLDPAMLSMYGQDIICLTGCVGGWVGTKYLGGEEDSAREALGTLRAIFERVYAELTWTGEEKQRKYNKWLIEVAKKDGVPLVATGDSHYTWRDQYDDHDTLFAMGLHKQKGDRERLRFEKNEYYIKSGAEMQSTGLPADSILNSYGISRDCDRYDLPTAKGVPTLASREGLTELALAGLEERIPDCFSDSRYTDRLFMELAVIEELKYEPYFMVAHEICDFARKSGLTSGWGRGSSAGSLVSFCLFITHIDPVRHGLYFERFLNKARREPPDIDLDFSDADRAIVLDHVKEAYGSSHVSSIATYGTLGPRQVIISSAKTLGRDEAMIDLALKSVPHDPTWKVQNVLESEGICDTIKGLLGEEVVHAMEVFQEIPRSASVHAAGLLLDKSDLGEDLPFLQTKQGGLATQYDYDTLHSLGYEKFDILGVRTLRVIADCVRDVGCDVFNLPEDDRATYDLLSRGDTVGVFQLEGWGYQMFLKKYRPKNFNDVMMLNALYRPGPMQGGKGLDEIIARRHGRTEIRYLHHSLRSILEPTYGVMVYQEQVMGVVRTLAGWDLATADHLRYAIAKKKIEEVKGFRDRFILDCRGVGHKQSFAEEAFQQIEYFSRYGWNKAHAAAYGMVTYATAYLKAHYRRDYMRCLLNTEMGNYEKIGKLLKDLDRSRISVGPANVNESEIGYTSHNGGLLAGLACVKGIGQKAAEAIVADRKASGPFASLAEFEARIPKKQVNSFMKKILMSHGAFRGLPKKAEQEMLF